MFGIIKPLHACMHPWDQVEVNLEKHASVWILEIKVRALAVEEPLEDPLEDGFCGARCCCALHCSLSSLTQSACSSRYLE